MASPFLQGFQVGSSTASDALNRNLRLQELKSQQQLRMLQEQQIAQQLAIQMENRNLAIQERADAFKAVTAMQQAMQPFIQVPMGGQEGLGGMAPPIMEVENPQMMTQLEAFQSFMLPVVTKYHGIEAGAKAWNDAVVGQARLEQFGDSGSPRIEPLKTHEGKSVNVFVPPRGRGTMQIIDDGKAPDTSDIRNQQYVDGLRTAINALPVGDPSRTQLETTLSEFQARTAPRSTIVRTNPDGTTEVVMGGTQSDLTGQQRGVAKLQVDKLTDTANRLTELASKAEDLFGPKAAVGSFVVDEMLSNLAPGLAKGQRIQGRSKAALVREGIVQALGQGQGQLSNRDIERLLAPFPKSGLEEVVRESPIDAKNKLISIAKELSRDAYEKSRTVGNEPNPANLRMMDPAVIVDEYRKGRITREQLIKAIDSSAYPEEAAALLKQ